MFKYTYKNEEYTDTTKNFMVKLGMDSETIESIQRQEAFELSQKQLEKIEVAKKYLSDTDFKMTADYDQDASSVLKLRAEARALIRELEQSIEDRDE